MPAKYCPSRPKKSHRNPHGDRMVKSMTAACQNRRFGEMNRALNNPVRRRRNVKSINRESSGGVKGWFVTEV